MDHLTPHPEFYNLPWTADSFHGMPYRPVGHSGLRVSNVGLGTWKMGYPDTGDGARIDEPASLKILDRALELGVTLWDTANRYNNSSGNSERILGKWMVENPEERRNVVLATKMYGSMDGPTPNHSRLSRTNILESVYASLDRMQVDYIDLLYFHDYDPWTPIDESLAAIEDLVRDDLVRYFGVSKYTMDQLRLYQAAEKALSARCRMVAVQNQFDILHGEPIPDVLAYAAQNGISFVAFSPLGRGLLTERYLEPAKAGAGDRLFDEGTLATDTAGPILGRLQGLAGLAREWGLGVSQLALAYMLALPGMGPVIPSATSVAQLEMNAGAGTYTLGEEQIARIRQVLAA